MTFELIIIGILLLIAGFVFGFVMGVIFTLEFINTGKRKKNENNRNELR